MTDNSTNIAIGDDRLVRHTLYASGNFGKSCLGSFVELFALFYLTDRLGIPAAIAGTVIFISLIWDAICDPIMGIAADRLREKFPTVRIYFLIGAPLTAVTFVGLFQAESIAADYRVFYIFIALILFRSAYTIVDIPHNSMLAFLSRNSRDRTNIASLRIFFSAAGRLTVTLAMTVILNDSGLAASHEQFSTAAMIFAAIYLVVIALCLLSICNIRVHAGEQSEPLGLGDLLKRIRENEFLIIVFALTAVTSLTTPIIGSAIVYYGKYGIGSEEAGATALVIMSACQAASLLFWSKLSNRMRQKKSASQYANGLLGLAMLIAIAALESREVLYLVAGLAGCAIGGIFMLNWSMLPDALDHAPGLSGRQYHMSIFGLYTLTNKSFIGLSQAVTGLTLAAYGYKADSPNMHDVMPVILSTLMAFPLLGAITCIALLSRHTQVQSHRI
ncbi:MFS transporter [Govanella unica]|uniref:MFS transporter n=1 Tax=Govanella unica TaxID=2975056 RepID=A0A9X3Z655_9PROT|nr:MFS transporter [Govania unica]MDA5192825.1 MFS transporter [Govania unica]